MSQIAVVTGAGSGVGRAVAVALLERGWSVALVGRRADALRETAELVGAAGERALVAAYDVGELVAVQQLAQAVVERFGQADALVNAAGTNTKARSLAQLSIDDYHRMIATNLNGAYYCVQAFLPAMRERGAGTIVNIGSISGLRASPLAGVAYSMSKFGLVGLTQSINAEERRNGIRACVVSPGEIDTPLLELRPSMPPPEARARMLQPEDVARCVLLAIELPPRAVIEELTVQPVFL
jgi:NAD(P)-dependent dehydrogenase (short-subunit alcohol dehydrogenase family)